MQEKKKKKWKSLFEEHQYVTPLKLDPPYSQLLLQLTLMLYFLVIFFLYELPTSVTSSFSSRSLLNSMLADRVEPFLSATLVFVVTPQMIKVMCNE